MLRGRPPFVLVYLYTPNGVSPFWTILLGPFTPCANPDNPTLASKDLRTPSPSIRKITASPFPWSALGFTRTNMLARPADAAALLTTGENAATSTCRG